MTAQLLERRSAESLALSRGTYAPRPYQAAIHAARERFQVVVAHRRAGKTVALVNHCIRGTMLSPFADPIVAYVAPTQKMAKMIAWAYAKAFTQRLPGATARVAALEVQHQATRTGTVGTLRLLGSENADRIRGQYLDGAVVDEAAFHDPRVIPEVILPALMDRDGWLIVAGTPYGANQLKRFYDAARDGKPGWRAWLLKASETGVYTPEQLAVQRANMSEAQYAQEFECSFVAVVEGAFYGALMQQAALEGRIGSVPYVPELEVIAACDLGMRDAFAVWLLQEHRAANQVRAIAYLEWHNKGLPQVKEAMDRVLAELGIPGIAAWLMPHDIAVRELGTGRARIEVARELGMEVQPATGMPLADGIEAVRRVLPRMVFDERRCERGLDALRQYRAEMDPKHEVQRATPLHSWESHPADALRTYATAREAGARSDWSASIRTIGEPAEVVMPQGARRLRRG